MHNFEGPVSIVCPEHHAHFMAIGGGGKAGPLSVPAVDVRGDDSVDGDISFSGDGWNLGVQEDAIEDGANDITEYTSDQYEVNERCSYYMSRVSITNNNLK